MLPEAVSQKAHKVRAFSATASRLHRRYEKDYASASQNNERIPFRTTGGWRAGMSATEGESRLTNKSTVR